MSLKRQSEKGEKEKVISEAKKNLIRQRILQDCPVSEIAEEAQVSKRTVQRIKKEMPFKTYDAATDGGDNRIKADYCKMLTAHEEKYAQKLKDALELYEDAEEGWVYHVTKYASVVTMSSRIWCFIAYPESAPEGWIEALKMTMLEVAISPLHDHDKWNHDSPEMVDKKTGVVYPKGHFYKAGDPKKAHWHGIVVFPRQISFRQANKIIQEITHGPYIQPLKGSMQGAYDYFVHKHHPDRYQGYDKDDIIKLNGFHIEPTKHELAMIQADIINVILERGIDNWADLMIYYQNNVEYLGVIANKPGAFSATVRSMWQKHNPDGKTQRVLIVNNNGEDIDNKNKEKEN